MRRETAPPRTMTSSSIRGCVWCSSLYYSHAASRLLYGWCDSRSDTSDPLSPSWRPKLLNTEVRADRQEAASKSKKRAVLDHGMQISMIFLNYISYKSIGRNFVIVKGHKVVPILHTIDSLLAQLYPLITLSMRCSGPICPSQ